MRSESGSESNSCLYSGPETRIGAVFVSILAVIVAIFIQRPSITPSSCIIAHRPDLIFFD
ncbi:hypothetical protein BDV06DRAFT_203349 [Aspergillus oleicola]